MQRGVILQYNPKDGVGQVTINGTLYVFTIQQWMESRDPLPEETVLLEISDEGLLKLQPFSTPTLPREEKTKVTVTGLKSESEAEKKSCPQTFSAGFWRNLHLGGTSRL